MYRVYVAGKLSDMPGKYIMNMHQMIECANRIRELGFAPFTPCLDILLGLVSGNIKEKEYYKIGLAWVEVSDAMIVLPNSEDSKGTQKEIEAAQKLNIPVFHNVQKLIAWREKKIGISNDKG